MKEDKIFNNKYNTGEIEFEQFGKIQVHDSHAQKDIYEEYTEINLQQQLYVIFKEAEFYEEYSKSKKVAKTEVAKMYYYFDERIPGTKDIPAVEKFISVAEFMSIPYETLYEELGPVYKEALLRELDGKYNIFSKRKIKRLF
jgi:hypothetical protein